LFSTITLPFLKRYRHFCTSINGNEYSTGYLAVLSGIIRHKIPPTAATLSIVQDNCGWPLSGVCSIERVVCNICRKWPNACLFEFLLGLIKL